MLVRSTDSNLHLIGTTSTMIRVLLVDDHPAVRLGLRKLIDDQPDMTVVAEAAGVGQALATLDTPTDVAIVDYHLGSGRDGLYLTSCLKKLDSPPRILVYSAFADSALAVTAILAGADGLLGKDALGDMLCTAVRRLARGGHYLPAVTASVARALATRLNPSDQAIFGMLLHGVEPQTIAEQLRLTPEQLRVRRAHILRRLKRDTPRPVVGAHAPLDYERPTRRAGRWAA
jgi:DNA-binding NarL/FixJ family response regulator